MVSNSFTILLFITISSSIPASGSSSDMKTFRIIELKKEIFPTRFIIERPSRDDVLSQLSIALHHDVLRHQIDC